MASKVDFLLEGTLSIFSKSAANSIQVTGEQRPEEPQDANVVSTSTSIVSRLPVKHHDSSDWPWCHPVWGKKCLTISINRSVPQWINQSVVSQSLSVRQSMSQSLSRSINHSVQQSSVNRFNCKHLTRHPMRRPVQQYVCVYMYSFTVHVMVNNDAILYSLRFFNSWRIFFNLCKVVIWKWLNLIEAIYFVGG